MRQQDARTRIAQPASVAAVPVEEHEFPLLEEALRSEHLPFDDLRLPGRRFFCLFDETRRVGYGGIEGTGKHQLLRSLVLLPEFRRAGLGRLVLRRLEEEAAASGAQSLHLLTLSAERFFSRNGYRHVARDAAPAEIGSTAEFLELCPASAAYMVKTF